MNTIKLARHYHKLSARKRLALIVAANARGDEMEVASLTRAAKLHAVQLPDYYGLAEAVNNVSLYCACQLLDLAARLASALQESQGPLSQMPDSGERVVEVGLVAYLFQAVTEAWKAFCAELHLDPDILLQYTPGYDTIKRTGATAAIVALTPEQAAEAVRLRDGADLDTVATVLADFRQALARGLTPSQRQAYRLADNNTGEPASFPDTE